MPFTAAPAGSKYGCPLPIASAPGQSDMRLVSVSRLSVAVCAHIAMSELEIPTEPQSADPTASDAWAVRGLGVALYGRIWLCLHMLMTWQAYQQQTGTSQAS